MEVTPQIQNQEAKTATPSAVELTGLNKRQQVEKANKSIFIWLAVASAVVALSLVLLQFLIKEAIFNQKIINKKSETSSIVKKNIENAKKLKSNVNALLADANLEAVRTADSNNNLQAVLDALPTSGDATTFSNSLYNKVLPLAGVTVDTVSVGDQAAAAVAATTATTPGQAVSQVPAPLPLIFTTSITGDFGRTKDTLVNLERTIRPINVTKLTVKAAEGSLSTTIAGETYYLAGSNVELGKTSVKP